VRRPKAVAVLGPTATGKSALALAIAERFDGEIINCDSTAVYRGFDIGTDKIALADRRGIPHHLIDIVDPTDEYTAAQFARDAAAVMRDILSRGRLPILAGGTGFYFRALTRGLFPGPGADASLRARLDAMAERRGVPFLHRMLGRIDRASALRIQPRDRKRLVRALEVFFLTGRPLTAHFADTASPIADVDVGDRAAAAGGADFRPRDPARRRPVRARPARRDPRAAGARRAGNGAAVRRPRLSAGARAPARRPRRAGDARADRPGEPPLRAAAVDLVP
jgi:tRNA A37 N6-isopentenylltransferase MiaA